MTMEKRVIIFLALLFTAIPVTLGSAVAAPVAASPSASTAAAATVSTTAATGGGGGGNPVMQLVGYVKDSVVRTVDGCGLLWKNHQRCNDIRSKQKTHREKLQSKWEMEGRMTPEEMKNKLKMVNGGITYDEFTFLGKGKEDRGKLMNVVFLMVGAPRFLPYGKSGKKYIWKRYIGPVMFSFP